MKTLIELFDNCQLKNVIAGLNFKPEKIIFVGFKQNMRPQLLNSLEKFFNMKNIKADIKYEYVSRYDYSSIVERLNNIIDKNEDCCFDLTGGRELVLVAMGEVSATRKIPMFQFDLKTGELIHVNNCSSIPLPKKENISIEECVTLNGGAVVNPKTDWDMNEEFCKDIYSMWNICKKNPNAWNNNSSVLASLEKRAFNDMSLSVGSKIKERDSREIDNSIIQSLADCGVIKELRLQKEYISFRYKNEQVRKCLVKSGNVLELMAYMLTREISAENNNCYNDIKVGVMVDWDGIVNGDIRTSRDTRNEVDVFLMRGHTPIFVSCKNGAVTKEALYELESVAEKFGGSFSRKVLLTTYINRNYSARNFIIQRAKDMKIEIIEGIDKMDREEFKNALAQRVR